MDTFTGDTDGDGKRNRRSMKTALFRGGLLAALFVLACVGLIQALVSRTRDVQGADGEQPAVRQSAPTAQPAAETQTESASPEPAPVPLASFPLLSRAAVRTSDGASYVDLRRPSGRWVVARRSVDDPAHPAGALSASGVRMRMTLPVSMVQGACLVVDGRWKRTARMSWSDSTGNTGSVQGDAGRRTVAMGCPQDLEGDQLYHVNFRAKVSSVTSGAPPMVIEGIWILDSPQAAVPASSGMSPCEPGPGVRLRPGWSLGFAFMARPDNQIQLKMPTGVSRRLVAHLLQDGSADQELVLEPLGDDEVRISDLGHPQDRTRPVELVLSLPPSAPDDVCLSQVNVLSAALAPVIEDPAPVQGVVFILVDTLRADAMRLFRPDGGVDTPTWQELASDSVVFTRATAHANYTKPSVGTILSGVYPHVHDGLPPMNRLDPSVTLLPERLARAGVQAVALFSNHFLNNRKFGFWKGWDHHEHVNSYTACLGGEPVARKVPSVIEHLDTEKPFLLYIHLMDPHSPYSPPKEFQVQHVGHRVVSGRILPKETSMFIRKVRRGDVAPPDEDELDLLENLYRADVDHMDDVLGLVVRQLDEAGLMDSVVLVATSDHGEEFFEHGGLGHGTNLYEELVHIPLLIRWPGGRVLSTVNEPVGHVDLVPTLLGLLDLDSSDPDLAGNDLLNLLEQGDPHWFREGYLLEHRNNHQKGVLVDGYKLLVRGDHLHLTHVDGFTDTTLAVGEHPVTYRLLRARYTDLMHRSPSSSEDQVGEVELSEEELEMLQALGYIMQ